MMRRLLPLLSVLVLLFPAGVANAARQPYGVRGGDMLYNGGSRCTIGASVVGGYVTAGICGSAGDPVLGYNQRPQGVVQGSVFPGRSMAWVEVNSDWIPRGVASDGAGGEVPVVGTDRAPVGATVCQVGAVSGWRCGRLLQINATVNFPEGTLYGLLVTDICAEPGDSGAPLLWNGHLQGIHIGGSGNCSAGGRSYYQPIQEILDAYGLTLVTS